MLRRWVARMLDLEAIRLRAEAAGLTQDQVARLEGRADLWAADIGMGLAEGMEFLLKEYSHLGIEPAAPVTTLEHLAVLRATVRRLVTIAYLQPLGRLAERIQR